MQARSHISVPIVCGRGACVRSSNAQITSLCGNKSLIGFTSPCRHAPMTEPETSDYASHSPLTDPGPYAALIRGLPPDVAALCRILHGLLIHEAWIERQGLSLAAFAGQSRATLPVQQRLAQLLAIDPGPLTAARPGTARVLATCRDFALMLC